MNKAGYIYSRINPEDLKQNVILMGDIIEDTYMANPEKHEHILSVGFLNDM